MFSFRLFSMILVQHRPRRRQVGEAGQRDEAVNVFAGVPHRGRGGRLAGGVEPGDARAVPAQGAQRLGQVFGRIGVEAVGHDPDARAAPQLGDALRISIGTPEQNQRVLAALDAKDAAA